MTKVFIDPGHGGKDPGAVGNGINEKDITLAASLLIGKKLGQHGVTIGYSRTSDIYVSLNERIDMANKWGADIFVSIHCNAFNNPSAQGIETYHYSGSVKGKQLAIDIHNSIALNSNLFTKNRGIKTAKFAVIAKTTMPAILIELGFITNKDDLNILVNRQDDFASAIIEGILRYFGIKGNAPNINIKSNLPIINGFPIISKPKATIEQMQEWAKRKGANPIFVDLAPIFYAASERAGINALVAYCQSAKETGYMRFGGVLNATYHNPCGLKISVGGGDKDPSAHYRFKNWEEGIRAQVDHLALYAGALGYPKANTPDPRHFPYLKGTAPTVESLGGKWAPSVTYGHEILKLMKEVEATVTLVKPIDPYAKDITINLLGRLITIKGRSRDNTNYLIVKNKEIPIRDIFEALGLAVEWKNNMVVIK